MGEKWRRREEGVRLGSRGREQGCKEGVGIVAPIKVDGSGSSAQGNENKGVLESQMMNNETGSVR